MSHRRLTTLVSSVYSLVLLYREAVRQEEAFSSSLSAYSAHITQKL